MTKDEFIAALPPIPAGKKLDWVDGVLTLVDEQAKDDRPIIERVKTFEDACKVLGEDHALVEQYMGISTFGLDETGDDIIAYTKLRIIAAALNEGWKPEFKAGEYRWYPWFKFYTKEDIERLDEDEKKSLLVVGGTASHGSLAGLGLVSSYNAFSASGALCGSRLAVKTEELADHFGKQFIDIWASFLFKDNNQD